TNTDGVHVFHKLFWTYTRPGFITEATRPANGQGRTDETDRKMRVAVVIATMGRPVELGQLLIRLACHTAPADAVFVTATAKADFVLPLDCNPTLIMGSPGSSAQRNRGLDTALGAFDLIAFFDDDYLPALDALAGVRRFFAAHPDV